MQFLLLFLEGIVTFVSPCLLPMLPVYLSFFAANETDRRKTLTNALGFVLGFTLVFLALGALAGTAGKLLREYAVAVNIVSGLIVIVFGLNFLGVFKIGFLNRVGGRRFGSERLGFFSSLVFGAVFSISWTPCVGAFLGSALLMASMSGSAARGIAMLLAYSAGLGIPFILSALLLQRMRSAFDFLKRHYRVVHLVSGVLLIVIGLLMMTGTMGYFLSLLTF